MSFEYTPITGLRDKVVFPKIPLNEDDARDQFMTLFDQVKDKFNDLDLELVDITKLNYSNAINVKMPFHGLAAAKGDGTTDDTSAIQAILDYASTNKLATYFPSGTYLISSTLNLSNKAVLIGDGWDLSILTTNSAITILSRIGGASNLEEYLDIRGLGFQGNAIGTGAIYFRRVPGDFSISEVDIQNFNGMGIKLDGQVWTGKILKAKIRQCTTCIYLGTASNDVTVEDCNLYSSDIGIDVVAGKYAPNNTYYTTGGARIINNVIQQINTAIMLSTDESTIESLQIVGNYIEQVGIFIKSRVLTAGTASRLRNINILNNVVYMGAYQFTPKTVFIDLTSTLATYGTVAFNEFKDNITGNVLSVYATSSYFFMFQNDRNYPNNLTLMSGGQYSMVFSGYYFEKQVQFLDDSWYDSGKGVVVRTPDLTKRYRLGVNNAGAVIATLV